MGDLFIVVGGEQLHNDSHWPAVPRSNVRSTGGIDDWSISKVRIRLAQNEVAGILVD